MGSDHFEFRSKEAATGLHVVKREILWSLFEFDGAKSDNLDKWFGVKHFGAML